MNFDDEQIIIGMSRKHGLGNRLHCLESAYGYAKLTGRKFYFVWDKDDECNIDFEEGFNLPDPDMQISLDDLELLLDDKYAERMQVFSGLRYIYLNRLGSSSNLRNKSSVIFEQFVRRGGGADVSHLKQDQEEDIIIYDGYKELKYIDLELFFKLLKPNGELMDQIKRYKDDNGIDKSVIGAAIRGTDWKDRSDRRYTSSIEEQKKEIELIIESDKNKRIFLTSDEPELEEEFRATFPNNVFFRSKDESVSKINAESGKWDLNIMRDKTSVQEAIVDMYLMAYTDFKIWHQMSSFGRISDRLSQWNIDCLKENDA